MPILIIRHGKPSVSFSRWCSHRDFHKWLEEFNYGGIDQPIVLSEQLRRQVEEIDMAFTSQLNRSKKSADVLAITCPIKADALFNEAGLPLFSVPLIKLPAFLWVILNRVLWLLGYRGFSESFKEARERGRRAAQVLIEEASSNKNILLIGHGWINRFIEEELKRTGWNLAFKSGSHYWDFAVFEFTRT